VYSAIRVRFIAQNLGAGSLVKAAIDDVDQDGLDNGLDLSVSSRSMLAQEVQISTATK
jgi:hypothetical protein